MAAVTGNGVLCTGITLAIAVATWIFSSLKSKANMGILLTFMFLVNMLGAVLLLPALAYFLLPKRGGEGSLRIKELVEQPTRIDRHLATVDEEELAAGPAQRATVC